MYPFKNDQYLLLILSLCVFSSSAQLYSQSKNLVPNYSFETYEKCPEDYTPQDMTHKLVPHWSYPTIATPDYFNRCSPRNVSVPANFAGESEPLTGDAYVGAILSGTEESYREYIQGKVLQPLVQGKKYCVRFSYKLASYSRFAVDRLSLYFSDVEIKNTININLPYTPQINSREGLFLDNIDEWEELCTVYAASGNEKYFIIGNFRNYENTNYVVTDKNVVNLRNKAYAYYYIDDVIITPLDNCRDCPCVLHDFESRIADSVYTGGRDPSTGLVEKVKNDGRIRINLMGGTPPYSVSWNNGMTGQEIRNLPAGVYVYRAMDASNCMSSDTLRFKEPEISQEGLEDRLNNIEEGSAIVLENVFFEFDKTALLPASYAELDKVALFMIDQNIALIEISGHTDSEGTDTYNQKLSEGRAESVVAYFISKGVSPERIRAEGYGETRPIESNFTEGGKAQNRRVEFTLIKK
jgi:outer membrane protein OmpA-like peptidoglycan-associated protein